MALQPAASQAPLREGFAVHGSADPGNCRGRPFVGPAAWTRADLLQDDRWIRPLSESERLEILEAVATSRRAGWELLDLSPARFPLPTVGPLLAAIGHELEHGRGIVQLRGLPVDDLDEAGRKAMLWGLGTYLGTGLSQSRQGDYLGEVTDLDVRIGDADARAYRSRGLSRFHFDRCDVVGLLCIRRARVGGESRVVSAPAVHNALLARRPDLADVFYGAFHQSRQGEQVPGERPWFSVPLFSIENGVFSSQLSFLYTESAQRFPDVPRLTGRQQTVLALMSALCDELYVESPFLPGDLQLLNSHVTYHCRAGYEDDPDPARRRLLYRLWLATPDSRPLPDSYRDAWGEVAAGAIRGGVAAADGWRDVAALRRREQQRNPGGPAS